MTSGLSFKASVDFSLARFLAFVLFLRFASSATPASLLSLLRNLNSSYDNLIHSVHIEKHIIHTPEFSVGAVLQ